VDLDEVIDISHFPKAELKLWQIHLNALVQHVERKYEGRVVLLRTRGQPLFCSLQDDFCWSKLATNLEVKLVPGSHEQVFMEPHVRALAAQVSQCLEASNRETPLAPSGSYHSEK
jgi:pyochelin synthetase